ncbi:MAG: DUF2550 domain-containing protein [Micrococcales bacterium]|nr:DUF2550 domain-containing protein [Micrococcales bacterium]
MSPIVATEVAVGAVILLAVLVVAFVFVRRRAIQSGHILVLCAVRTPARPRWRLGYLRFGKSTLGWFSVAGPSLRPVREWPRSVVELSAPQPLEEPVPGLADTAVRVAVDAPGAPAGIELALSLNAYTALRSWTESQPPGRNIYVA